MKQLRFNDRAVATLENLFASGRVPHALLFEGEPGSGKKTAAALFCALALCAGEQKPCGTCPHCLKIDAGAHPDVLFYTVPEGKKEFPVDLVREMRQQVYVAPNEGARTVCIIDSAHTMSAAAQNALLKVLEEPPAWVSFVLLAQSRHAMLPTILSRVVCVSLAVPSAQQCAEALCSLAPQASEQQRADAAQTARGNIGQALLLLEQEDGAPPADIDALLTALVFGERYEALRLLAAHDRDREGTTRILAQLGERFAALARAPYTGAQEDDALLRRVTPAKAMAAADAVHRAGELVSRNVSIPLLSAAMVEQIKNALV